jgi:2-C-methyl-D-erythritol 4-phosphate cytidylyltransferase
MNGRIVHDATPEGRLAAVAKSVFSKLKTIRREPDYADYRDALRPFVRRELILARIEESRKVSGRVLTERMRELAGELMEVDAEIEEVDLK